MADQVLGWVKTIVVYVILVSAVMNLLPDNQYKKYVQLFTGLLLILIVMEPVAGLLGSEHMVDTIYQKAVEWQEKQERQRVLSEIGEAGQEMIYDAYEQQVENHIREQLSDQGYSGVQADVTLSEDGIRQISLRLEGKSFVDQESRQKEQKRIQAMLQDVYEIPASKIQIRIG